MDRDRHHSVWIYLNTVEHTQYNIIVTKREIFQQNLTHYAGVLEERLGHLVSGKENP
jgi:hypothetical protein